MKEEDIHFIKSVKDLPKCPPKFVFREYSSELAISRSIGDFPAKIYKLGGNGKGSILSVPDVFTLNLRGKEDFLILGCNGIYDEMDNFELDELVWFVINERLKSKNNNVTDIYGDICNMVIKRAMHVKSEDNLSCIFIAFENLLKYINSKNEKNKNNKIVNNIKKVE